MQTKSETLRWIVVGLVLVVLAAGVIYALFRSPGTSWGDLRDVPPGFADGIDDDTDTLLGLGCSTEQIARWNGTAWVCAPDSDVLAGLSNCFNGQYAVWDKRNFTWICGGTPVALGARSFNSAGTFTIPENVTQITVELWGGGGGGGGSQSGCPTFPTSQTRSGGGGGSGGHRLATLPVTAGSTYTVIVGAVGGGGSSSSSGSTDGSAGSSSELRTDAGALVMDATGGGGGDGAMCGYPGASQFNAGYPNGVSGASGADGGAGGVVSSIFGRANGGNGGFGGSGNSGYPGFVTITWY